MGKQTAFVGDRFSLNNGGQAVITAYRSAIDVDVVTNNKYKTAVSLGNLRLGRVNDPMASTVCGVGCIGGRSGSIDPESHSCWNSMITRCYSSLYQSTGYAYIGCTVDKRWHNYSVFADWYDENHIEGYQLDKDLILIGNKVYSEETCVFAPRALNLLFATSRNRRGLPLGVKGNRTLTRFSSSISQKSFRTVEEARDCYWAEKTVAVNKSIERFPQFHDLINNYLPQFKAANWDAK